MFLEDNTFEIMTLENDILYESIHLDILKSSIMEDIYTENGNSAFDRFKKFIDSVVEKIKKFFINAKKVIINFFTKKAVNDKLNDIVQSIKENPELGKREVKIPDYKELDKLYEKTISDLEHRVEDSEKIMEKYKKERKRILIGAAGLITVSLATAIGIVKNIGKKTEERLNKKIEAVDKFIKETLQEHDQVLKDHDQALKYHDQAVKDYAQGLLTHSKILRSHNQALSTLLEEQCEDSKKLRDINTHIKALETERRNNDLELQGKKFLNLYASIMCDEASDSVKEVKDIVSVVINNSKGE